MNDDTKQLENFEAFVTELAADCDGDTHLHCFRALDVGPGVASDQGVPIAVKSY